MFGKPKGFAFQKLKSLLYIKVVGVFQKLQSKRDISSLEFSFLSSFYR